MATQTTQKQPQQQHPRPQQPQAASGPRGSGVQLFKDFAAI